VERLTSWDNANSELRKLTEMLDWVCAPEGVLQPRLEGRARTHVLPLLLKDLLILFATRILHPGEAKDPQRDQNPANSTESHSTLAHHEAAEPEP
jgi:hypothetical protein